jgi:hypothetical protein
VPTTAAVCCWFFCAVGVVWVMAAFTSGIGQTLHQIQHLMDKVC